MKKLFCFMLIFMMTLQLTGQTPTGAEKPPVIHKSWVTTVCFDAQGNRAASGALDSTIIIWDVSSGKALKKIIMDGTYPNQICFTPDGTSILAAQRRGSAALYDIESGKLVRQFAGHDPTISVYDITISPDGKYIATGSQDHTAKLFDLHSGELICTYSGHTNTVFSVSFSHDGKYLITGSADKSVRVWDLLSGAPVKVLAVLNQPVTVARCHPQGGSVLVATMGLTMGLGCELKLFGMDSGNLIHAYSGHFCEIRKAYFSEDGKYLAICGNSSHFSLWDSRNSDRLRYFKGHPSPEKPGIFILTSGGKTIDISISPDNRFIISGGDDETVRLWDLDMGELVRVFGQE